ncbi:MAG: hypothetical protein ABJB98_01900 [Actinomycetota bacterium]
MTRRTPDPTALEAQLRALGHDLAAGPTPDLRAGVTRRTSDPALLAKPPARRRTRRTTIAVVLAGAVASGTTAAVASPDIRARISSLIHFHGIDISRQSSAPPTPSPTSTPAVSDLGLGSPVDLAVAQRAAEFQIRQPQRLGDPRFVLLLPRPLVGAIVTLVYPPSASLVRSPVTGTGALLTEFAGDLDRTVFRKILSGIATARETTVNGAPAIWAVGPQDFFLVTANAEPYGLPSRPSASSMIWAVHGVTYRLEVNLPFERAREIAESVR